MQMQINPIPIKVIATVSTFSSHGSFPRLGLLWVILNIKDEGSGVLLADRSLTHDYHQQNNSLITINFSAQNNKFARYYRENLRAFRAC
jgi:hypothetical protein